MWKVPSEVSGFNGQLKYVDSCPNEPVPSKAFCYQHCVEAEKQGIPTNLHEYKPTTKGKTYRITYFTPHLYYYTRIIVMVCSEEDSIISKYSSQVSRLEVIS